MKNHRGLTLIECMISVLVLSFAVSVFASLYPIAMRLRYKSGNVTLATALCQKKIEQLRATPYTSLDYSDLQSGGLIDASPTTSPYSFTSTDSVASKLPQGTGSITISTPATDLTQASVTITWGGDVQNGNSVTLTTLIANTAVKQQ